MQNLKLPKGTVKDATLEFNKSRTTIYRWLNKKNLTFLVWLKEYKEKKNKEANELMLEKQTLVKKINRIPDVKN